MLNPDNEALYYGQEFVINVSQGTGSSFIAEENESVYLLELDEEGDTVTRIARVLTVNDSDYITLETDDLDGSSFQQYALNNETELNGNAVNFTLNRQDLETDWEAECVASDSESAPLNIRSTNRNDYNVTIRADGFDYQQLRALFIHPGTDLTEVTARDQLPLERVGLDRDDGDGLDEMRSEGYITLNLPASTNFTEDDEIVANFSNLEANETVPADGDYQFETLVTDSTADSTTTLCIGGAEADFEQSLYTRAAGDIASFTVSLDSTDETWVQLRDTNSEFVDVLYLEDGGDGQVTFYANTRLMGTNHSQLDGISAGDSDVVYYANDTEDTVQSYIHHEVVPSGNGTEVSDAEFYDGETVDGSSEVSFSQYIQSVNGATPTDQLARPLATTTYELVLNRDGRFTVDDGEAAVNRPLGETELDLVQPALREFDTYVAPAGDADEYRSISELQSNLTSRDAATIGDRLVLRYNTTGIGGALAAIDYAQNGHSINTGLRDGYSSDVFYELAVNQDGTDWEGDGVNFSLLGEERPNRPRERLALDNGDNQDAYVLFDQQTAEGDAGTMYVVIDTGSTAYDDSIADEKQYDAELTYIAGGRFEFSGQGPQGGAGGDVTDPAFPYYDATVTENVTERGTISFESTRLEFDAAEDGTVTLEPTQDAMVSGETNLAPGTELTVAVRLAPPSETLPDEDPSFLEDNMTTVGDDGSFNATLDLSGRTVGESATVRVERGQTTVASSDAEFVDISAVQGPYFETELDVPATAQRNETVNITGTVTNAGTAPGTADVTVAVTGTNPARGIFDLEPGESRRINRSVQMGQRDISVSIVSEDTSQMATVEYEDATGPANTTPTVTQTPTQTTVVTVTPTPTPTPAPAVDGPQGTPPGGNSGGGFPWLFAGIGAAVTLAGAAVVVIRWL